MYLSHSMKQDKVKRFQWRVIEVVLFLLSQVVNVVFGKKNPGGDNRNICGVREGI